MQLLDAVKARYPGVPVIFVTGTGSDETGVEALKRGAADYVIKTTTHIQRLPQTIHSVLERHATAPVCELGVRASLEPFRRLTLCAFADVVIDGAPLDSRSGIPGA